MATKEELQDYFNEQVINHEGRDHILAKIKQVRNNHTYNYDLIVAHFEKTGLLVPTENGSHSVNYTVLDSYFMGERGLMAWAMNADFDKKDGFIDQLKNMVESGGSQIDIICKPLVDAFGGFDPDYVVFTGYGESMAECLADNLSNSLEKEVKSEYLSMKEPSFKEQKETGLSDLPLRTQSGVIVFEEKHEPEQYDGKNVIVLDRLMDPFTTLGMVQCVQELGAQVLGVAGLFATKQYDPEYALPVAKIDLDGWQESTGMPYSPGPGKFSFFFPAESAHLKKRYKFNQKR